MLSLRDVMVLSSGLVSHTWSFSNVWRMGRMRTATSMLRLPCFYFGLDFIGILEVANDYILLFNICCIILGLERNNFLKSSIPYRNSSNFIKEFMCLIELLKVGNILPLADAVGHRPGAEFDL